MRRFFYTLLVLLSILLAGCSAGHGLPSQSPQNPPASSPTPTPTKPPTQFPTISPSPTIAPTPTLPQTPTLTPTPIGGGNGQVLVSQITWGELIDPQDVSMGHDTSYNLLLMDINDPPGRVLISKAQIEDILNKKFIGVEFDPSPDKKNTVIYALTNIDRTHGFRPIYDVYLASLDLQRIVPIQTNMELMQTHWNWSPDGTKLAGFISVSDKFTSSLKVINRDGSEYGDGLGMWETLDEKNLFWLPDSSRLSFTQWDELVELNLDVLGEPKRYHVGDSFQGLQYSPNGQKVAIFYAGIIDGWEKLVVANADFSNPLPILERDYKLSWPTIAWSPDNKYIVIQGGYSAGEILKAESGESISINLPGENMGQFCGWSPDYKFVFYLIDENGSPYLYLFDPAQLDSPGSSIRIDSWEEMGCPVWLP